ncbi:pyridoxamine 5'-phosphate oxidase family protein (plasmid) [Rhizobium sp. WSM1274]|uniref:pyridoxamine 5'-phosphate oxidase family protein n=1 Tax=unclassified Rhizobium TaxID=2613769 RepID=UPI0021A6E099|nr:pyridoxamine 5'-phosphate oxidase family protein [Rhizobium leguminosarum]UWU31006.1 pyridoxamine 5'-phosphate oxidase family protein [Rhizobium leguminosarum bv. viciae]
MDTQKHISSDVAFSSSVKEIQTRKGSRRSYARVEERGGWATAITPDLKDFIEKQISIFMATANKNCQPYIQHRGGPPGFLRVIDETTLGFADYVGNRQYITQGNLVDNDKAQLFLIDYGSRSRVKIWGRASVVEGNTALIDQLMPKDYQARPEQVILFHVEAWDANCPQHIPLRFEADEVLKSIESRDARIKELEAEIATLKSAKSSVVQ